jgi:hypothetical protein
LEERAEFVDIEVIISVLYNPLRTQLNPICHFLALLGTHHILHVSSLRVKYYCTAERGCAGSAIGAVV